MDENELDDYQNQILVEKYKQMLDNSNTESQKIKDYAKSRGVDLSREYIKDKPAPSQREAVSDLYDIKRKISEDSHKRLMEEAEMRNQLRKDIERYSKLRSILSGSK